MKIVNAKTMVVEIPFHLDGRGTGIMPTAWNSLEFALVRLEDDAGNIGWGDGFGYFTAAATTAMVDRLILSGLIGAEIDDIPAWNLKTQRALHMFGRFGVTIFAISAVDIALWDLAAKRKGVSLAALLAQGSAPCREKIPFYASLVRYGDVGLVNAAARSALDVGFDTLKLHEAGLREIEACRSFVGAQVPLSVDVNCAWSVEFVREHRHQLEQLNLVWLEEPIFPPEDYLSLKKLRGQPARIAAGENWSTARQCIEPLRQQAVDIFQPSIIKIGGVSEYLSVIDTAASEGISIIPHTPYFGPGFYASLQIAAARPAVEALEYNFVRPDAWLSEVEGFRRGSIFSVPQGPGIGFEPDLEVLERYRRV